MSALAVRVAEYIACASVLVALIMTAAVVLAAAEASRSPDDRAAAAADASGAADNRIRRFLRRLLTNVLHLYFLRFPLLVGLVLVAIPMLALKTGLRTYIRNLLVVTPIELLLVSFLVPIVAWIVVRTAALALAYGPARFNVPAWPRFADAGAGALVGRGISLVRAQAVVILAAPIIACCALLSLAEAPYGVTRWPAAPAGSPARAGALLIAVIAGAVVSYGLRHVMSRFDLDPERMIDRPYNGAKLGRIDGLIEKWLRFLGPGYAEGDRAAPGHVAAIQQLGLCIGLYIGIGILFSPVRLLFGLVPGWAPDGCWSGATWMCMPTLGYLCVVLGVAVWLLSGASFLFDRWRAPVVLTLIVAVAIVDSFAPADHYYRMTRSTLSTVAAAESASLPPPEDMALTAPESSFPRPDEIVARTLAGQTGRKRLVVLAISGGGITSAAWSARVLTGLEEAIGRPFTEALSAVSTVSGGSVGAMYYFGALLDREPRPDGVLGAIQTAAASPGMRSIAWGIAYPDFLRVAFRPALFGQRTRYLDRALAAETAWENEWTHGALAGAGAAQDAVGYGRQGGEQSTWTAPPKAPYLLDLRTRLADTDIPFPMFNAMTVDDGQQFIITPVDLVPKDAQGRPCHREPSDDNVPAIVASNDAFTATERAAFLPPRPATGRTYCTFRETYPDHDIPLSTAARLSATFPWVSPVARPHDADCEDCGPPYHLSDGGYFDNSGLSGVMAWLDQVVPRYAELAEAADGKTAEHEILVVQVMWGRWERATEAELDAPKGALFQAGGPIHALTAARGSTQTSTNARALRLMNERWSREALDPYRVKLRVVDLDLASRLPQRTKDPLPLAWQLTDAEQREIDGAWCTEKVVAGVQTIADYLGTTADMGCQPTG